MKKTIIVLLAVLLPSTILSASEKSITPEEIIKMTASVDHKKNESYLVEITGIGKAKLDPSNNFQSKIEDTQDFIYPTKYSVPVVTLNNKNNTNKKWEISPSFPFEFKKGKIGISIELQAKRVGSAILIFGTSSYTSFLKFNHGIGELTLPVLDRDDKRENNPNTTNLASFQTTTTVLYITALPNNVYEIPVYNGKKFVKRSVIVTVQ